MIRHPVVAGQFYPGDVKSLRAMLAKLIDKKARKQDVIGLLMPHAGYPYSGKVAGAAISRVKLKETCIIMGPSHTGAGKPFSIMTAGKWQTPLGEVEIDEELAKNLAEKSAYLREDERAHRQEHAVEVQLPFLQFLKPDVKIVPIVLSYAPAAVYKEIGREISAAIRETGRQAVIIASGDMTHYEPQEVAREKDSRAIEAMLDLDEDELTRLFEELRISMCAHGPAVALIAAAKELGAGRADLVKYQTSGDTTGDYSAVVGYAGVIIPRAGKIHPLAALAKKTVEGYTRTGKVPQPPKTLTPGMQEKAATFVSIHKLGDLRGCIGTFHPQQSNVAMEIIVNAISAATRDPRFHPVNAGELKYLDYSVDVLSSPEPVKNESQLDPGKYGAIVEAGWRRGLLLPDLEGVDTPEQQINICRQKAGIGPKEKVQLYRFEVKRYK